MKKYFLLFSLYLSQFSIYRTRLIMHLFGNFITPLFLLAALFYARPTSGLSASSLVPYYLLIGLLSPLIRSDVDEHIQEMAVSGEVNNFLTKPLSFYKFMLSREISLKTLTALLVIPIIVLFLAGSGGRFWTIGLSPALYFFPSLILAFLLVFNFSYFVGLFSFWIDEFWAIHNLKYVVIGFFSGAVLPFEFFPAGLINVLSYTPFFFMINWPIRVLQGQFHPIDFISALAWLLLLSFTVSFLQHFAIKKYSFTAG